MLASAHARQRDFFTLLVIGALFWAQSAGAFPSLAPMAAPTATSTGTIAYQGRLADAGGAPLTGTYSMIFRIYNASTGSVPLWTEQWTGPNSVQVSDGLFNVMLGSMTSISQTMITGNNNLWLGITVGTDDEMLPRVQLGSVPFAVQALTVPDGSVTTAKIADGAVTSDKLKSQVGMGKLSSNQTLDLGSQWTRKTIPDTSMTVTVNVPSRLMIWYATTFVTQAAGSCGEDVILTVDGSEAFVSTTAGSSAWYSHSGSAIVNIASGTHSLFLEMQSSCNAQSVQFIANRTSLVYQVVSQ